jgi:hypothetical protein
MPASHFGFQNGEVEFDDGVRGLDDLVVLGRVNAFLDIVRSPINNLPKALDYDAIPFLRLG